MLCFGSQWMLEAEFPHLLKEGATVAQPKILSWADRVGGKR